MEISGNEIKNAEKKLSEMLGYFEATPPHDVATTALIEQLGTSLLMVQFVKDPSNAIVESDRTEVFKAVNEVIINTDACMRAERGLLRLELWP